MAYCLRGSAHSSTPEKVNALIILFSPIRFPENGAANLVAFVKKYFSGDIYGKAIGLYSEGEYVNGEFVHRNVISPTLLETKDKFFNLTFNLRNSFGTTREDIEYVFRALSLEYGYTWQILSYYDPIYVAKDWPFIKVLGEAYKDITGELNCAPALSRTTMLGYAHSPGTCFFGRGLPSVDERISSLVKATKFMPEP